MANRLSPSETYHPPLPDEIGRTFLTLPDSSMTDNICLLFSFSGQFAGLRPVRGSLIRPRLFFRLLFRLPGEPFEHDKVRKGYCQQTHQTKRPKQHCVFESPTAICE